MPFFNYKCDKCEEVGEFLIGKTTGTPEPTDCPMCDAKDSMRKLLSVAGISGEVVGGYEYEYGKKSWKRTASMTDKAGILAGTKDPY